MFFTRILTALQDHPIQATRVTKRQHRDHSAHRQTTNVGLLDVECVHQRGRVVGHVRDGVRPSGLRAAASIAVVEDDDLKLPRQCRNLRERPKGAVVSDPHHPREGGAFPIVAQDEQLSPP